jgi:transposase
MSKDKRTGKLGVRYSAEFKTKAIQLCRTSAQSVNDVGELLGVSRHTLEAWLRQAAIDEVGAKDGALTSDERRELKRLRREVEDLKAANTILKKAEAFSAARKR